MKNRFYVGKNNIVYERTGIYEFDEPVAIFHRNKCAKISCKALNVDYKDRRDEEGNLIKKVKKT
jgi:hypothetical protein